MSAGMSLAPVSDMSTIWHPMVQWPLLKTMTAFFERSAPWGAASLGDLLVGCSWFH
jgi:hypothetical protein